MITAQPTSNAAPAGLKVRKNIETLSAQVLTDFRRAVRQADFRRAVRQAIALNDNHDFDYFAG